MKWICSFSRPPMIHEIDHCYSKGMHIHLFSTEVGGDGHYSYNFWLACVVICSAATGMDSKHMDQGCQITLIWH